MPRPFFRRLLRWLLLLLAGLVLLLVLFLTIPGIECDWKVPAESRDPWLVLSRSDSQMGVDVRRVRLGPFGTRIIWVHGGLKGSFLDLSHASGMRWEHGTFYYVGDHMILAMGAEQKSAPAFLRPP